MSGFLLDTNCISELVRATPEPRVVAWMESTNEDLLYLSVLTLGEIRKGLAALSQGSRRAHLESWIQMDLPVRFGNRILPIDEAVADRWGLLAAQARSRGTPLPIVDGLLAATAIHFNLTVVSRNVRDFANAQVPVLNPWEA